MNESSPPPAASSTPGLSLHCPSISLFVFLAVCKLNLVGLDGEFSGATRRWICIFVCIIHWLLVHHVHFG